MYLIDSSIWVEVFRKSGNYEVKLKVSELLETDEICICPLIAIEILGFARKEERKLIQGLFGELKNLVITKEIWESSVTLLQELKDKGINVPWSDIVIYETGRYYKKKIFAKDSHFNQISKVTGFEIL